MDGGRLSAIRLGHRARKSNVNTSSDCFGDTIPLWETTTPRTQRAAVSRLCKTPGRTNPHLGARPDVQHAKKRQRHLEPSRKELHDEIRALGEAATRRDAGLAEEKLGFARTGKRGDGNRFRPSSPLRRLSTARAELATRSCIGMPLLTNVAYCSDGKYRAVDLKPFFQNKMLLGAIFRSKVARHASRPIGAEGSSTWQLL